MIRIITIVLVVCCSLSSFAQRQIKTSTVLSSEPQNKMASQIPEILLEAYRNGHIRAYYPERENVAIPYTQFLAHFGEADKAQKMLGKAPAWFCVEEAPKPGAEVIGCLSEKFQIIEKLVRNPVTQMNELKQQYIRLVYSEECHPAAISTYGPVFKVDDLKKLVQKPYRITNPENEAVSYAVNDILLLRLFKGRVPLE